MHYERILIELDEGGWVRFTRPHGYPGGYSRASLEIPQGFTFNDVLAAVAATGWVVEQGGELRIEDPVGCDHLAKTVEQMFSYFERADEPRVELRRIRDQVALCLTGVDCTAISLWAYAWLDLAVRNDVADAVRSMKSLWENDLTTIDVGKRRARRIAELCERFAILDSTSETVPAGGASVMAASARTRDGSATRGRSAG
jgi:hypothetical protein